MVPADAAQSSSTQVVWRFTDLEPTRDVGATYVRASAWRAYAEAEKLVPYVVLDQNGSISQQYKVTSLPTIILVDPDGAIHGVYEGYYSGLRDEIESDIRQVLKKSLAADGPA